jgi:hypothetical protein
VRVRTSATTSILLASLAVAGAAGISLALRRDALRREEAYTSRYQAEARLAGQVRPASLEKQATPPVSERICVTGLDTFASAIARRFAAPFTDPTQGVALVRRVSSLAVIGERHADAAPPPALPKRMGRARPPAPRACDGTAYAEVVCDPALVATCPKAARTSPRPR